MARNSRFSKKRGLGIVEVLVAAVILSVSLAAIASMFTFGFKITRRSDDRSVAYNISRKEMERIRSEGFKNTIIVRNGSGTITSQGKDGTETVYYNTSGAKLANATGATYSVTITITSDRSDTVNGVPRPADDALRTVIINVRSMVDNAVVFTDGTCLARSGV